MLRQRMRCDAPPFLPADYDFIIQRRDERPRSKVLYELKEKYSTSQKCIYQIWRGEEKNRVAWDQPIHMPTASLSSINIVGERTEPKIQGQDVSLFTELENVICNDKVESNISTDSVLEGGGKAKKTGEKKLKPKSSSTIQTQLIPVSLKSSDINNEEIVASYENVSERHKKNKANIKHIIEK